VSIGVSMSMNPLRVEIFAHRHRDAGSATSVLLHRLAAQVDHAVVRRTFSRALLVELEGRRERRIEDLDVVREHLDLSEAMFGLTVPSDAGERRRSTLSTYSLRTFSAVANVALRSGSETTCASPSRSRKSMKITPP